MEWEAKLTEAGYRITAARRAVMQVLLLATAPLSPQELHTRGRAIHPALGLVSVYRTLDLLEQLELVRRVHLDDGCHGYLLASPGHRHALLCRCCGQAVEFPGGEDLSALIAEVQRSTGYRVEDHLLQLIGLCPACQVQK